MGVTKKPAKPAAKTAKHPRSTSRALPGISTSGADAVWHGSSATEMQVGSPEIVVGEDGITTTTLIFGGLATALETDRPARGAIISGYSGSVVSSRLRPGKGSGAILTVVLKTASQDEEPETSDVQTTTWEVDWRSVEKPLVTNAKLVAQGSGTTQTAIDEVEAWRNSPQQRHRNYQIPLNTLTREPDPDNDAEWEDLAGESLAVAKKVAAGIESWLEFNPVIMKITICDGRPTTGGCGKIGAPDVSIAGYVYLKTGDNAVQQTTNLWRRTETWQGSASWDTDLYANA